MKTKTTEMDFRIWGPEARLALFCIAFHAEYDWWGHQQKRATPPSPPEGVLKNFGVIDLVDLVQRKRSDSLVFYSPAKWFLLEVVFVKIEPFRGMKLKHFAWKHEGFLRFTQKGVARAKRARPFFVYLLENSRVFLRNVLISCIGTARF